MLVAGQHTIEIDYVQVRPSACRVEAPSLMGCNRAKILTSKFSGSARAQREVRALARSYFPVNLGPATSLH